MTELNIGIASVTEIGYRHINMLALDPPPGHRLDPDPAGKKIDEAEDALARLDERLGHSPIREGWIARTHLFDAAANLWLEGDLVALEDLVLHDCSMDIRTPTHELTRAHMLLRARRRIAVSTPGWAFLRDSQDQLLGRLDPASMPAEADPLTRSGGGEKTAKTPLDEEFAAIDALIARTSRRLARGSPAADDSAASAEETPDRLTAWRTRLSKTHDLSPVAAAAAAGLAWDELSPIENAAWLGRLLAAEILRVRGKTRVHLCTLNIGLKSVARADRQSRDPEIRRRAWIQGFALAAEAGLRDHDRWLAVRQALTHKLKGRRVNSKLPGLVELVLRQPLVTSAMIAQELRVSTRAAQDLAGELGLREMTGRARYRAWGIL